MKLFLKNRYVLLFWAVLLFLLVPPFFPASYLESIIVTVLLSVMVIQSVAIIFDKGKNLKYGVGIGLLILVVIWLTHILASPDIKMQYTNGLLFIYFGYILFLLIRHMIREKGVDLNMIMMAITVYLLIAIEGGFLFGIMDHVLEDAFNISQGTGIKPMDYTYYAFVTLTTLGYGDIVPLRDETRVIAAMLATGGQFYIAVVLAFMVGKFISPEK